MNDTFHHPGYHWSRVIVPPGYADPVRFQAGGPRGTGHTPENGEAPPGEARTAVVEPRTARGAGEAGLAHGARPDGGGGPGAGYGGPGRGVCGRVSV